MGILEFDPQASDDFRWPYFSFFSVELQALDQKATDAYKHWAATFKNELDLGNQIKAAKDDKNHLVALIESGIDDENFPDHIKTKDERKAFRESLVLADERHLGMVRIISDMEKKQAEARLVKEQAAGMTTLLDRQRRWRERVIGCLSTFAPESEASDLALAHSRGWEPTNPGWRGEGLGWPESRD